MIKLEAHQRLEQRRFAVSLPAADDDRGLCDLLERERIRLLRERVKVGVGLVEGGVVGKGGGGGGGEEEEGGGVCQ